MYLGIDIGGTKTLVATLDDNGVVQERNKFPTPKDYGEFSKALAEVVDNLTTTNFVACAVAVPGKLDRPNGIGLDMGNLPWHDVPIQKDVAALLDCPVVIENDANLAGLSEAMLLKDTYSRVLYVTISTGIGTGFIVNQTIDPALADSEGGHMPIEYKGKLVKWESFASGHAIATRFGKQAHEITDDATWKIIAHDVALGLIDLIAVIQPQVIVLGGSVGSFYERYGKHLQDALDAYATPMVPIPVLMQAGRPEEAVIYGCYDLAKSLYGKTR